MRSNYAPGSRQSVEFTATIPSGSYTSEAWPFTFGEFALGTVAMSGALPATSGHLTVQVQDVLGVWRWGTDENGSHTAWCIQKPSAGAVHSMPAAWFGIMGSARLAISNGTASGIPATATQVFCVSLKT
jgi:hypothetical protein